MRCEQNGSSVFAQAPCEEMTFFSSSSRSANGSLNTWMSKILMSFVQNAQRGSGVRDEKRREEKRREESGHGSAFTVHTHAQSQRTFVGLLSLSTCARSMARRTSMPPTTCPKTECLRSRSGHLRYMMKNCEPFVFGPLLAMLTTPRPAIVQ